MSGAAATACTLFKQEVAKLTVKEIDLPSISPCTVCRLEKNRPRAVYSRKYGTPETLGALVQHLNARLKTISFTSQHSLQSIDYLDITIFKGPRFHTSGILDIRLFSKLIDPHAYFYYSSAHHRSVIHGMIKGEMIRALRRSSSPQIYASAVQHLETWFLARGYSSKLLKDVQATLQYSNRESFLRHSKNRKWSEMTTVLSVKNHPSITWAELHQAVDDPLLPFKPLISRRRPPNVVGLVVRAETPSEEQAQRYHLRRRETQN